MSLFIAQSVCNQGILQRRSWELFSFQTALPLSSFLTSLLLFCSLKSKWLSDSHLCSTLFLKTHSLFQLLCLQFRVRLNHRLFSGSVLWAQSHKNRKTLSSSCDIVRCTPGPLLGDPVMHHAWHNTDVVSELVLETHAHRRRQRKREGARKLCLCAHQTTGKYC